MAREFYDWVKLALDNKWLVMMFLGLFTSAGANVLQLDTNKSLETEAQAARAQIAEVATYLSKKKTTPQRGSQELSRGLIQEHEQEYHR